ncbi:MAG: LysR family transcriptional regulator [Chloroflexi bacterium]|nr:LysR family transcriptional regulator [Chloroflexota bacterium]BCY17359.1 LysR family transcriptional regulator [Leptolinea sp. HRD-7]
MELRYLKTFHTIATLGSFYRAAEVLGYAQSTVSDQIKTLETDLQVTLFKRAGNQLSLTPAGERLFQYAPRVLNMETEIRQEVGEVSALSGTISMRVPETVSLLLLPLVQEFHKQFPRVNFAFNACTFFGIEEELHTGTIDLAFLLADEYKSPGVNVEALMDIPLTAVAAAGHRLAAMPFIELAELRAEPFLIPTSDCNYIQMLEKILTAEKMELPQIWRMNTLSAIKQILASGTGVSVLPRMAVQPELDAGVLVALNWRPLQAKLLMIRQKNAWQPPVLEAFMAEVRKLGAAAVTPV